MLNLDHFSMSFPNMAMRWWSLVRLFTKRNPLTYLLSENNMKTVPHKTKQWTDFFHNNFFFIDINQWAYKLSYIVLQWQPGWLVAPLGLMARATVLIKYLSGWIGYHSNLESFGFSFPSLAPRNKAFVGVALAIVKE